MENPTFRLEGVVKERGELTDFEGPLSLILMLLSKNRIEIRDISISEILEQYLDYLAQMEAMDLEIASEFVQMAAYLLYIKTKTLLSTQEEVTELETLISSLEQLRRKDTQKAIKTVLPWMAEASEQGLKLITKPPEPRKPAAVVYDYRHEPADLLKALLSAFSRGDTKLPGPPELRAIAPRRIVYGVRDKSRELIELLRCGTRSLRSLYAAAHSRSELVATFISVLELCSMGSVVLTEQDGELQASFTGGDTEQILDAIEE